MNTLIEPQSLAKLFKLYYSIDISVQFLKFADMQLTNQFLDETGIALDRRGQLICEPQIDPRISVAKVSCFTVVLLLKYGKVQIRIQWSSKSGKIYGINDNDIDCEDIQFSFDNLDIERCRKFYKPDFSKFFTFYETAADFLKSISRVDVSTSYIMCMREHLSRDFEFKTGLKINKNIDLQYNSNGFFMKKEKYLKRRPQFMLTIIGTLMR